jgi:predicted transcriptional regulator
VHVRLNVFSRFVFLELSSRRLYAVNFISVLLLFTTGICVRFGVGWAEMEIGRRRRGRVEVVCDILTEALGGANKTRLMYHCNLNFMRFNRYLEDLLDAGLLERASSNPDGLVLYKTSDKGRELIKVWRKANEFLSA